MVGTAKHISIAKKNYNFSSLFFIQFFLDIISNEYAVVKIVSIAVHKVPQRESGRKPKYVTCWIQIVCLQPYMGAQSYSNRNGSINIDVINNPRRKIAICFASHKSCRCKFETKRRKSTNFRSEQMPIIRTSGGSVETRVRRHIVPCLKNTISRRHVSMNIIIDTTISKR
jgi:hypothetical protein